MSGSGSGGMSSSNWYPVNPSIIISQNGAVEQSGVFLFRSTYGHRECSLHIACRSLLQGPLSNSSVWDHDRNTSQPHRNQARVFGGISSGGVWPFWTSGSALTGWPVPPQLRHRPLPHCGHQCHAGVCGSTTPPPPQWLHRPRTLPRPLQGMHTGKPGRFGLKSCVITE